MSLNAYREAAELISAQPDLSSFVGPRSAAVVEAAERALGCSFPPSYRQFILEFGAGSFAGEEFFGVISEPWPGVAPDAVGSTLREREDVLMPSAFILIGEDFDGEFFVLNTADVARSNDEAPVLRWTPGVPVIESAPEPVADCFGTFLRTRIEEA